MITSLLHKLRRAERADDLDTADDLDLIALINEARTDADRFAVARQASLRARARG